MHDQVIMLQTMTDEYRNFDASDTESTCSRKTFCWVLTWHSRHGVSCVCGSQPNILGSEGIFFQQNGSRGLRCLGQVRNQGGEAHPLENFLPPVGKICWTWFESIGHSLKNLGHSMKTLRPPGVPSWTRACAWGFTVLIVSVQKSTFLS